MTLGEGCTNVQCARCGLAATYVGYKREDVAWAINLQNIRNRNPDGGYTGVIPLWYMCLSFGLFVVFLVHFTVFCIDLFGIRNHGDDTPTHDHHDAPLRVGLAILIYAVSTLGFAALIGEIGRRAWGGHPRLEHPGVPRLAYYAFCSSALTTMYVLWYFEVI